MAILLGVDTGGTYTDAVVWDEAASAVLGKAKALTTHRDLAAGIGAAMDAAMDAARIAPAAVSLVSLSTTLATNALVEGHGDPAALVLIGFGEADLARAGLGEALGREPAILVAGGHRSDGSENAKLDELALRAGLRAAAPVSAIAVASVFAVRNPAHERRAREIAREETGLPVTASHELSAKLGGPRRALTTLLNARLVGMIDRLIQAAEGLLAARGVAAPLMVVKGDGALMSAAIARNRPIETILSGPAASLVGAAKLTGLDRALVADIGGTTTDIAVIEGGRPRIDPEGAKVGPWRTMVEAAAMRTHGLGGDSEVSLEDSGFRARLLLGPRRAVPVSLFALGRPEALKALARQRARPRHEAGDGLFLAPGARTSGRGALPAEEAALIDAVGEGAALDTLRGGPKPRAALERLVAEGFLRRVAFTPSDAAHVLGLHGGWDGEAASMAASLFARRKGNDGRTVAPDGEALSRMVMDALTRRSTEMVLEAALAEDGMESEGLAGSPLGSAALDGRAGFACARLTLTAPLIGLGASAPVYYPAVARLAGAEPVIPDHADVANAVGAVAGRVEARAEALILSPDGESFDLMTPEGPRRFATLETARKAAEAMARGAAAAAALEAGAAETELALRWEEKRASVEAREMLAEARLVVTASGRPRF